MKKLPLKSPMLALALLPLLLAACGGSDDKDSGSNSNNPADPQAGATQKSKHPPIPDTGAAPPNDEEKAAFNASKISIEPYNALNGAKPAPFLITAEDGTPTRGFDGENAQRDFSKLSAGFTSVKGTLTLVKNDNNGGTLPQLPDINQADKLRSYQGFRSGVVVGYYDAGGVASSDTYGITTPVAQIPVSGKATYTGAAFDRLDRGTFIYNVDFATRQGDGRIENISRFGMVTLKNAALTEMNGGFGVTGNASDRYKQPLVYQAMFYGNRAEEMAGQVVNTDNRDVVGFHGARGDIVQ